MVVTIGDVVGRGIKAAVAMGQYRDMLRAYAFEGFGPAAALSRLNDVLHALGGEAFATCTVVVLDRVTRRIVYASAGHPPLMLRLLDGTVRVLDGARSMPIGAWPETRYIEAACDMPIGATLLFYTDGLVETRHRSAAEGVELLAAALSRSRPDIELMLEDVLHDIAPDRSDDIAILAIEMLVPQSETLRRWVFPAIDRATVHAIEAEFDTIFERRHIAGAEAFGARTVLGELLSNVARHAPGAFRLELNWGGEFPELSLYDSGPGFAPPAQFLGPADILSTTGRGLFLVAQTSRSVKMARRPSGGLATNVVLAICQKPHARQLAPSVSGEGGEAQNAGREMPRT
jgi:anti-sigma regulatory factor (Ser/Thr protein kinase)